MQRVNKFAAANLTKTDKVARDYSKLSKAASNPSSNISISYSGQNYLPTFFFRHHKEIKPHILFNTMCSGPQKFIPRTGTRSVQPFCTVQPLDKQTDWHTAFSRNNAHHVLHSMRPKSNILKDWSSMFSTLSGYALGLSAIGFTSELALLGHRT